MRRSVLALAAAVVMAIPTASAFAQSFTPTVVQEDGASVTVAPIGTRTASSLSPTNSVNERLSDGSRGEAFRLEGVQGDCVLITMRSSEFDPYLQVRSAPLKGAILASDDDSAGGRNAQIRYTLPSSGRYYITATSFGQGEATGRYELDLTRC
jgi:hypothetical protein